MQKLLTFILAVMCLVGVAPVSSALSQRAEKRIALVVGNSAYPAAPLPTSANDAGLIAQTLQAAGFDVVGARDLDQDSLRRAFRDFLDKATAAGPNTAALIYLSGYGLQLEGENYFVPVDAKIANASDVPAEAIRISDYVRPLAALKLRTTMVVLDAARPSPFARNGAPLAGGLALVDPPPGTLIAFNAAPGTVAPASRGNYGAYAQALAEMMREGGLAAGDVFERTRLRVNEMTKGAEIPWDAAKLEEPFTFFVRAPNAPPPSVPPARMAELRSQPLRALGARDAYLAALDRDTLQGYLDFLAAYPDDPMARRVRAIVAARREAITWWRTRSIDTPRAYWSYLRRYPRGLHAYDARRRLEYLEAALAPPPSFEPIEYEVPPPPPDELVYVDREVIYFDDPDFDFPPPPPPPVVFLPPPPAYFVNLPPPPPPVVAFILPIPIYHPIPVWVQPPAYVAPPPPTNIIYQNIHNTVIINNRTNLVTITNPAGQQRTLTPTLPPSLRPAQQRPGALPAAAVVGATLPPSLARKIIPAQNNGPGFRAGQPNGPLGQGQGMQHPSGLPLPGPKGQPLPTVQAPLPKPAQAAPGAKLPLPNGTPPMQQRPALPQKPSGLPPERPLPHGLAPASSLPHGLAPATPLPHGLAPAAPLPHGLAPATPLPHGLAPTPPRPGATALPNRALPPTPQHLGIPAGERRLPPAPVPARPSFNIPKAAPPHQTGLPHGFAPAAAKPLVPHFAAPRPEPRPMPQMMERRPTPPPIPAARPMPAAHFCPPGMRFENGHCGR